MKRILITFAFLAVTVFALPASAQDTGRHYWYESISYDVSVQTDTTFTVSEEQRYNFVGEYHKGWRSIPYKGISAITDIKVFDGVTGQPLVYSPRSLEKTDSASWGKYTYFKSDGAMNIEWYYNTKDEIRTWMIEYTVHGGITFLKDKDELYWNLFTDYEVPVDFVNAEVSIPDNAFSPSDLSAYIYRTNVGLDGSGGRTEIINNRTFRFSTEAVSPGEDVTIAVGWPKGIVDQSAFWRDWFLIHWVPIASALIILLTIGIGIFYWYWTEKRGRGRGTIIAQYEPPHNLRPAMAEIIVRERVTSKAWAATVVDLAVRGYLRIEEDPSTGFEKVFRVIALAIPFVVISAVILIFFLNDSWRADTVLIAIVVVAAFAQAFWKIAKSKKAGGRNSFVPSDYTIKRIKEPDGFLEKYERSFLYLLGSSFSTKEMKKSPTRSREMYKEMQKLEKELLKETETDTGAYEKPIHKEKIWSIAVFFLLFAFFFSLVPILNAGLSGLIPFEVAFICVVGLCLFIRYEARLSREGAILKEEWLGFKLYLETAERYRLQNLTPETFEKYLPYAIIFGVEKKWGKAFDSLQMSEPSWYAGAYVHGSIAGSAAPSFSASAFSSSFSSSFSSAFSSSGGGGVSGGGGGAGGGGGGGGGGAS